MLEFFTASSRVPRPTCDLATLCILFIRMLLQGNGGEGGILNIFIQKYCDNCKQMSIRSILTCTFLLARLAVLSIHMDAGVCTNSVESPAAVSCYVHFTAALLCNNVLTPG